MTKQKKHIEIKPEKRTNKIYIITAAVIILLLAGYLIIINLTGKNDVSNEYVFQKEGELVLYDSTGKEIKKIDIEVADTDYDRQLGLMFRTEMKDNQGMLFIFPSQDYQSFWMRNTNLSLDMMFINSDKKIVTIHKNTQILSDQSYPSSAPAQYVLETIAGFTDKYGITEGSKVNWMTTRLNF